tara:strand:+ start:1672 stop:2388 length:717 start_codon:yes stop_codon:yes gene_type:complete
MTHVACAAELLRPAPASGSGCCTVAVLVPFGPGLREYRVKDADLARLLPIEALQRATLQPVRWAMVKVKGRGAPCTDHIPVADDAEMKDVYNCLYITAGKYYDSFFAWDEYTELRRELNLSSSQTAIALGPKPKPKPATLGFRAAVVEKQAYEHERLEATYDATPLGDALCTVLAQCLRQLCEADDVGKVWAALYTHDGWLAELEAAAAAAGNPVLAATARRLLCFRSAKASLCVANK